MPGLTDYGRRLPTDGARAAGPSRAGVPSAMSVPGAGPDPLLRPMAGTGLGGIALFVLTAVALQFARAELDWIRTPMSFYLLGDEGRWLQAGYVALACAIVALAVGWYRALPDSARSGAPTLLFLLAATGLGVTAFAPTAQVGLPPTLWNWLHGVAAQTAFLCVTTAMLLQAWRLRIDRRWRRRFVVAFAVALVAFAGVWLLALWRELPRGLAQKVLIAIIVSWLATMSVWLWRDARAPG